MARPLWSDAGDRPAEIADHLDRLAETATTFRFEPRPLTADRALLHQAALIRARRQLTQRHGEKDRILAEEVRAIDDLVRSANLMVERLREWYALHAPEATRMVTDAKQLADVVAQYGDRTAVLTALDHAEKTTTSLGTDLEPADIAVVQGFAAALKAVHDSWEQLEKRVGQMMEEVAPNVSSVVGPVLGARMIALAGSLQKLATVPAGTVQLYGAETALFRHIKEGTKPPKHGVIFMHPKVHQAPPWQRGAISRSFAQHISLAAKADAFTGNDLREHLAQGMEADLALIARKRARPPARPRPGQAPFSRNAPRGPGGPRKGGFGPRDDAPRKGGFGPRDDRRGGPRPGGKPGGSPGGKPGGKPYGKPGGKSGGKPGGKPYGKKKDKFSGGPAKPPGGRK